MASSWGEELLRYKQEKLRTPWDVANAPAPHRRAKWASIAAEQRAFNPVLQRPVKTAAERHLASEEKSRMKQHLERAVQTRLKHTYVHYDPISNQTRYPSKIPPPKKEHIIADTRTDYNILNFQDHFNKDRWNQFTKAKPADLGKKTDFSADITYAKDFDIVSTKYKEKHDERVQEEFNKTLAEKQNEFHKRNVYNPVRGTFYNKNKEIAFRHRRKEFMEQHSLQYDPPKHLQNTDGALFNILNHEVFDEEGMARKEAYDNRSLETKKKKVEFENLVKERQAKEYELNLSRKLARVSHQRDGAIRARGYDPLTNQPFSGVGAKQLAPSQQVPKPTGWERAVHASTRVLSNNQERRERAQTSGRRALRSGSSVARSRTVTASRPEGPGVPFIPRERKLKSSRPRGQTGRVNVK